MYHCEGKVDVVRRFEARATIGYRIAERVRQASTQHRHIAGGHVLMSGVLGFRQTCDGRVTAIKKRRGVHAYLRAYITAENH